MQNVRLPKKPSHCHYFMKPQASAYEMWLCLQAGVAALGPPNQLVVAWNNNAFVEINFHDCVLSLNESREGDEYAMSLR